MTIKYFVEVPKDHNSDAALNRAKLFEKGLKESGVNCSVVKFVYGKYRHKWWYRLYYLLKNHYRLLYHSLTSDIIVLYGGLISFRVLFNILSKVKCLVIERTEYPTSLISQAKISKEEMDKELKLLRYYKYAKGFITCSSFLKEYYTQFASNAIYHISPLIVDMAAFSKERTEYSKTNLIVYCGSFNNLKDGIPTLIEAFLIVSKKYPQYKLMLIGGGSKENEELFRNLIREKGLEEKVVFTGKIPHHEMSNYLSKAEICALARPDNKQAEGGIPSKLAEYLASGRPCVITNVGDISLYMKDGYNCYMAAPSSVMDFAKKLEECIESKTNETIILNGLRTVQQFNYSVQCINLIKFFKEISCTK